jgi:hypothetical protein
LPGKEGWYGKKKRNNNDQSKHDYVILKGAKLEK